MYDPERYETHKSAPGQDIAELVPQLVELMSWKNNEQILDYGCGAGSVCKKYYVPKAIQHNSKIDAVDISETMILYAKTNNAHPLVEYHLGNIMAKYFLLKDKSYDRIFGIYVLHYIKDFGEALERFYKILKPNGQLGIIVLVKAPIFSIIKMLGQSAEWGHYMKGYEEFLPKWYEESSDAETLIRNALTSSGYLISEMRTEEKVREFETETYLELFVSANPFLKIIPTYLLPKFKDYHRQLVSQPDFYANEIFHNAGTGKLSVKYSLVFCAATKPSNS